SCPSPLHHSPPTSPFTLSLPDALPIYQVRLTEQHPFPPGAQGAQHLAPQVLGPGQVALGWGQDLDEAGVAPPTPLVRPIQPMAYQDQAEHGEWSSDSKYESVGEHQCGHEGPDGGGEFAQLDGPATHSTSAPSSPPRPSTAGDASEKWVAASSSGFVV